MTRSLDPSTILCCLVLFVAGANAATFVTYDTALSHTVPYYESRLSFMGAHLVAASENVDVMCLQQLWEETDLASIHHRLKDSFPYSYSFVDGVTGVNPACSASLESLSTCLGTNCRDEFDIDFETGHHCMMTQCNDTYADIYAEDCDRCVKYELQMNNTDFTNIHACTENSDRTFRGTAGLLLLSRTPLLRKSSLRFNAMGTDRGLLYAETQFTGSDDIIGLSCTQLTAPSDDALYVGTPYGAYASFSAEHDAQVSAMLSFLNAKTADSQVLLGGLSSGPASDSTGVSAVFGSSYETVLSNGWKSAYVSAHGTECTYCSSNTLVAASGSTQATSILDNILLSGLMQSDYQTSVSRLFVESSYSVASGVTDLSTHYGLSVTIELRSTSRFVSYNLGLLTTMPAYAERRSAVEDTLLDGTKDVDVLCLQEVWEEPDQRLVKDVLADRFPHVHSFVDFSASSTASAPACTADVLPLAQCANDKCLASFAQGFTAGYYCVMTQCNDTYVDIYKTDCDRCLKYQLGAQWPDLSGAVTTCVTDVSRSYPMTAGIMLFTRTPMFRKDKLEFNSVQIDRGLLYGEVDDARGLGRMGLMCTHLTDQGDPRYYGPEPYGHYSTFELEQRHEIFQLDSFLSAKEVPSFVLMGDLNTGPANPDTEVTASFPENYELLLEQGWYNPYVGHDNLGSCTWCDDNTLAVAQYPNTTLEILDHVMLRGQISHAYMLSTGLRFHTHPLNINDSGLIVTDPSDHYGVHVEVRARESSTFMTFNTALLTTVPAYPERRAVFMDNIKSELQGVDYLCLQEAWEESDQRALVTELTDFFPYVHSFVNFSVPMSQTPPCAVATVQALGMCLAQKCMASASSFDSLYYCAMSECGDVYGTVYQKDCDRCLKYHLGLNPTDLNAVLTTCASDTTRGYGLTAGVMLFSRTPLVNTVAHKFTSFGMDRGMLYAETEDAFGLGTIGLACSHLTHQGDQTYYGPMPYGQYGTYEFEQRVQIHEAADMLTQKSVSSLVWMGDFNTGPASEPDSVTASFGDNYAAILEYGFTSPYIGFDGSADCTWCADNTLATAQYPNTTQEYLDHVFLRGRVADAYMLSTSRHYTSHNLNINYYGMTITDISDHYGVSVTLKARTTSTLMTYNVGLLTTLPVYAERTGVAADLILDKVDQVDYLCLQEVWQEHDQRSLASALKDRFPYMHSFVNFSDAESSAPACSGAQLGPLSSCVATSDCLTSTSFDQLYYCVMQKCNDSYVDVYQTDCDRCLKHQMAIYPTDMATAFGTCMAPGLGFGLTGGVMLMSRTPLTSLDTLRFTSMGMDRVFLYAETEDAAGLGHLAIGCTHLTHQGDHTYYGPYPYGQYDTYKAEQLVQIQEINAYFKTKREASAAEIGQVLLGDFNTGPDAAKYNVVNSFGSNYDTLIADGWDSTYVGKDGAECTWCEYNSLAVAQYPDTARELLDHIFTRGSLQNAYMLSAERDFMNPLVSWDYYGVQTIQDLSDHYAVRVVMKPKKTTVFQSYNTALLSSVPHYSLRREPMIESLVSQSKDVDVLCLQEVWEESDQRAIVTALQDTFPYVHSFVDFSTASTPSAPSCTEASLLNDIGACILANCSSTFMLGFEAFYDCLATECTELYEQVYQTDCDRCLKYQLGLYPTDLNLVFTTCATDMTRNYGLTGGIMLFSRKPMANTDSLKYVTFGFDRGLLYAEIEDSLLGSVGLTCTHLTHQGDPLYYGPLPFAQYKDYADEQKSQVIALDILISGKTVKNQVLMGDFNTGPESAKYNITASFAANYDLIRSTYKWVDDYVGDDGNECTWCAYDTLALEQYATSTNELLDHVFSRGPFLSSSLLASERNYIDQARFVNDELFTDLSDHYGVKTEFSPDYCAAGMHECSSSATCTPTVGSYTCECNSGFLGSGLVCTDINECEASPCSDHADCANTPGSYTCTCHTGYFDASGECKDIEECASDLDNCNAHASCTNTPGSFHCVCLSGFEGNGIDCGDIDECHLGLDSCHANATCSNTHGAYTCMCNPGFDGDGIDCEAEPSEPSSSEDSSDDDTDIAAQEDAEEDDLVEKYYVVYIAPPVGAVVVIASALGVFMCLKKRKDRSDPESDRRHLELV
eukprot:TRINITY_DN2684_c0_g1::TRINITY_DN2684_c0_g1_i1::g.26246::m.26246 TRINITY_DN2684_c0_g1::TRINITY_DN2684_c0_g1_i1::g.26246  ORF type:complete len:2107 (-),score=747.28,sp/P10493/NID1_MOUSE/42.33/3e-31,sp/P10493/NID1_MOUSE/41.57/2e-10,Exo_endo_phos/PF03372.18/18,Exo_endo_phos/PF03372.18/1e-07,Exo_endo_phos/PF03372.18/8.7e-12,Exo_endo_phos/PF03372.18/3e-07,Exo_endo_phos/PF03372.18/1e-08,EGF_3/PF12947.2/3.3e-08,EGF_3/PF12947.2/0.00018,EGF_3/PF12947.2/2e-08,EGF_3/PF12947.2/2e-08,EGF_CA/PF07645.10/1.5e+0